MISLTRWSPRGLGLRGHHAARLGSGDRGNHSDAPGPYQRSQCRGSHTRWSLVVSTGFYDKTLRVWELKDGNEILTFTQDATVTACIVAQDNRTIVAGDDFGRLHFLRLVEADKSKSAIGDTKIQLLRGDKDNAGICHGFLSSRFLSLFVCSLL
jgi:WD40 repeat protein